MKRLGALVTALTLCICIGGIGAAQGWSLAEAAKPYAGTSIKAIFLDRPGYKAAAKLLPEFEKITGIKVNTEVIPYENTREKIVLDMTARGGEYDVVLTDVVWIGEFASNGWLVPLEKFYNDPKLADPALNLKGFFPILLDSFGTWDKKIYGLPFDNYAGLLFYNKCMLQKAGFSKPPATWEELLKVYAPKLTNPKAGVYAFALQSRRGETQSADSFMRMLWPFGGSLIDPKTFEPNLLSPASLRGLQFRQDLMKYMPPGIVDYDHNEAVNALAQGKVAMITEWSAFYTTLADPKSSKLGNCLGVATEPAGPAGLKGALGGFSYGVNAFSPPERQAAAYLFIQWITSEAKAKDYVRAGGVSARMSVYKDPAIQKAFPFTVPMVKAWEQGNPIFRPRFPEWPEISEVIAQIGTEMMLGKVSVKDGAAQINAKVKEILTKAGYYDGKKPKLQ
ncbi:extracellular solute-binding protein family 1 [Allomeiothermus silvanus DSM 9946]|uniref:Extracellular solute-binding protein family 1 n=1 Tax=Allomeiothermus silvanus (strain ATCC 700542 / DSM 9946 / NBRC 106475 / NCIMB 13440 / VI-R2) TaxID=526227 RepID=D7BE33_ALLS1|nr:sugar ABC transporter substrate-binding protein [Allomeiothermus silvanus]ADH64891.1 extracellular solute-binding protein family 1 [Allomeiothermus silvanus DSM 9946]